MSTVEEDGTTSSAAAVPKARSRNGVPRVSLATAELYARAVWEAARLNEAAPVSVARIISGKPDTKASGGGWRAKLSALRGYKLIERLDNDNLKLSALGRRIVNDSDNEARASARREAVLAIPSYSQFLSGNDGVPLPAVESIAGTFEYTYGLKSDEAKAAANFFVESAKLAGVLDEENTVHLSPLDNVAAQQAVAGDDAEEVDDPPMVITEVPEGAPTESMPAPDTAEQARVVTEQAPAPSQILNTASPAPASQDFSLPPATVSVNIDMSKWAANDVISVLTVLGYGASGPKDD